MEKIIWFGKKPKDENTKIWRYMTTWKFEDLLKKNELFFCRADKFDDKYEGNVTNNLRTEGGRSVNDIREVFKPYTYINCWHENEQESKEMWKLYLQEKDGVAIQSTFKKLETSIIDGINHSDEEGICLFLIEYIDFKTFKMPEGNGGIDPFLYKNKEFEVENEFRLLLQNIPVVTGGKNKYVVTTRDKTKIGIAEPKKFNFAEKGKFLKIDLDELIESIIITPTASNEFKQSIESILENFGINKEIQTSKLKT